MKKFSLFVTPATPVVPTRGLNTQILVAGQSITVAGADAVGGYIIDRKSVV